MYLFTGIIVAAFVFSFWKDNRSLWNPALFLLSLISIYLSVAHFFYQNGYEKVHIFFLVFTVAIRIECHCYFLKCLWFSASSI